MFREFLGARRKLAIFIGVLIVVFAASILWLKDKPVLLEQYDFSTSVYDREGNLLRLNTVKDESYRVFVPLDEISKNVIEATLLYEDRYFRSHPGFNPIAMIKAAVDTYIRQGKRRGASTITMQLARMHFKITSRTPMGKIKQIAHAIKLEIHYSKKEILEAYLNLAPYGGNLTGIKAASLVYFGKEPGELTLAESMALCVIPQNPRKRKPTSEGMEPSELVKARTRLAKSWIAGHPEHEESQLGLTHPLKMRNVSNLPFLAPHFTTTLLMRSKDTGKTDTTIDLKPQKALERRISSYVERNRASGIFNAAAMLIDHRNMEVLALVGSADFHDKKIEGQVSAATSRRSPGSTLKPFVYALAMDQGIIHPGSLLKDAPATFAEYTPHNFDGEYRGPLSATEALVRSRNIPAIALASKLQSNGLYEFVKRAGVKKLRPKSKYGLAPVLGGIELTMEDLVRLYALLAGGGVLRPLEFRLGSGTNRDSSKRLLSKEASFLTLAMLFKNPRPGQGFKDDWIRDPSPVSWKTGTSPGSRDAWSVGVFGRYVLAVWVGQFKGGRSAVYVGRKSAAPLFFEIVDNLRGRGGFTETKPGVDLNIAKVDVCVVSGALPGEHCSNTKLSWFIPGKSPIARCDIHQQIEIDTRTGMRACDENPKHNRQEVFEFWPSDLAKLFKEAGLPRKLPPPYGKKCRRIQKDPLTSTLEITSPRKKLTYSIRAGRLKKERIAFKAISDADALKLFWFVDSKHVGRVDPGKTLFWKPTPGTFSIRVVDDKGRFDTRRLVVEVVE
ncbi:MAG: penicillin-binding protein 1C [Deltaproteobacteria bacterium]|nr:penicillin-binding protein 1C [Deltaproteobacteria bacterium]